MSYKISEEGNVATVHLDGEIDMDVTEKAKEVIMPLIEAGKEVYLRIGSDSNHSDYEPTAVSLTITALQDQVPQALSARPGMTLETGAGICDGSSVSVASGTYTMPDVTTYYEVPHASWNDFPGSQFSYKPPPGTNRVFYKLKEWS